MKKIIAIATLAISLVSCKKHTSAPVTYEVNESTSKIEWKGSATDHFHVGSFDVNGALTGNGNGVVNGGEFIIPIASIQDFDLTDPVRQTLLDDLKSANFFNLVLHPEAKFHITQVKPYSTTDTAAVANANYMVTGDFTMVGQTHPLSFPVKISVANGELTAEAKFNLDRTKWGMNIYSDPTKPLYILPEVNIHLLLKADKQAAK